jgi:uncharacterized protein YdhG (YjbR/CyaY superfamily)
VGSIEEALAALPSRDRTCLQHLIDVAREAAPEAVDGVSYGVPALILEGKPLLGVAATARHLAVYPFSPAVIEAIVPALGAFSRSKGTIRFSAARPLPDDVVNLMVQLRSLEITEPEAYSASNKR